MATSRAYRSLGSPRFPRPETEAIKAWNRARAARDSWYLNGASPACPPAVSDDARQDQPEQMTPPDLAGSEGV